jgi:hypothetical protein
MEWRKTTSWMNPNSGNASTIQSLIGHFLRDRLSPSLLDAQTKKFQQETCGATWGQPPYEKVVESEADLDWLINNPSAYKNAVCIIEPASNVGQNNAKEDVRASSNIAYLCRVIADCDSILFPLWKLGNLNQKKLDHIFETCLAVFVEGGYPTAKDPESFAGQSISLRELQSVIEHLVTARTHKSAPHIFICIGHQLSAQAHVNLIQKAISAIRSDLPSICELNSFQHNLLMDCCDQIEQIGLDLTIQKNGLQIAKGWNDNCFAVALNEVPEVGHCELHRYEHDGVHPSLCFNSLLAEHVETSDIYNGIVEQSISYEKDLNIVMFHSDEVNEESILFSNWAYSQLHHALHPSRHFIALSELSWLLSLPRSIEILCSTFAEGSKCTEVAATCITYIDRETKEIRRSFSFQFHPELLNDLREFNVAGEPNYAKLKSDDGIRMLMRVLYESMID